MVKIGRGGDDDDDDGSSSSSSSSLCMMASPMQGEGGDGEWMDRKGQRAELSKKFTSRRVGDNGVLMCSCIRARGEEGFQDCGALKTKRRSM